MNAAYNALANNCCIDDRQANHVATLTTNPLKRILSYLAMRRNRRLDRLAMRELLSMDDSMLKDIGVSRGDVQWASNLPLSISPTTELEIIARRSPRTKR